MGEASNLRMQKQEVRGMTDLIKYESGGIALEARIEDGQAWLTYEQTARLFDCGTRNVELHVSEILASGELRADTAKDFFAVRTEGNRSVSRKLSHINQDMVLHVGYRVRSDRGSEFRRWATAVLKGEAQPLAAPKPQTIAELCLVQAQVLVQIERAQAEHERRLANVEAVQAKSAAELDDALTLPAPPVDASERTYGQMAIALVKSWGNAHSAYDQANRMLYQAVLERPETRIDLRARLEFARRNKERGKKPKRLCDIIDESGKDEHVYAIARQLFADSEARAL